MRQGDVWWGESPDEKGRPYLVITRNEAIPVLRAVLVAPLTRTVRGIASEVALGPDDGLPTQCVASLDNILTFPKSMLTRRAGRLESERWSGVCDAIRAAVDC